MKQTLKAGIRGTAFLIFFACGNKTPDYDATGTFEATEIVVSAEVTGRLLRLDVEEGARLQSGEEVGLIDTVQIYLKKLQLEAGMKSVENQLPDLPKQIAAIKQQISTARHEKERVENLLAAGAATHMQLDDRNAQVELLEKQLAAHESTLKKKCEQPDGTRKFCGYSGSAGGRFTRKMPYPRPCGRNGFVKVCRSR